MCTDDKKNEHLLASAVYADDFKRVKKILSENPDLDLNKMMHAYAGKRGNGTPLVLAGTKEVAALLLSSDANINEVCSLGSVRITALDSALKELSKEPVKNSKELLAKRKELVAYLKKNGAVRYKDLLEAI